jgi:hypothetical protein
VTIALSPRVIAMELGQGVTAGGRRQTAVRRSAAAAVLSARANGRAGLPERSEKHTKVAMPSPVPASHFVPPSCEMSACPHRCNKRVISLPV